MEPVEQVLIGLIIVAVEMVLINTVLLLGLRDRWRILDNDPEESEDQDGFSYAAVIVAPVILFAVGVLALSSGYALTKSNRPSPRDDMGRTEPTSTTVPWVFSGHVYRVGTQEGLAGAIVYLDVLSAGGWQAGVASDTSDQDGSFALPYELPSGFDGKMECQLRVELPPGWNYVVSTQGRGWDWSNTNPNVLEGSFGSGEVVEAVTFEMAIRRTFAGTVYFEGEDTPDSATVQLRYQDQSGQWSDVVAETVVERPPESQEPIVGIPFTLEHISILEDLKYQVSIASPPGTGVQDWAAGAPLDIGQVEGSAVAVSLGRKTEVAGIVFAGPLPVTLTYRTADFDPAYDPSNPGMWRDESVPEEVTYPFAAREEPDVPQGAWARWPVYLPGGNAYEIWVAIPGQRSSAVVSYTLRYDESGQPGIEVPGGMITNVVQCRNDAEGDEWVQAAIYSPDGIGPGGLFWLVVDEGLAHWPEGCLGLDNTPYPFRMPVWKVIVRLTQR